MGEPAEHERILVIDDDHAIRLSCRKALEKVGFRVEVCEDGARGLEALARVKPDLVVVDLKMPGIGGMEVISRVHEIDAGIVIVVITGYATIDTAVEAMKCGAYDFLPKPFSPDELRLIVRRGLERRRLSLAARRCELDREILKRKFVTFVSHQLRAPLAAVHQYISVLKQLENSGDAEAAAAKREEWFDRCQKRIEEMQGLIHDWLMLAKVESGTLAAKSESVDLNPVVSHVLENCETQAAAAGIVLEARLPPEPCPVRGDPNCLNVLLDNLVTNAIKYNKPRGRVLVSVELQDGEVQISVSDTGVGIPEKYRKLLFEEFFRVADDQGRRTPGTGLGLAICKRIVSEMGGSIGVESEAGAGSTFRVRLLREPGHPAGEGPMPEPGIPPACGRPPA